MSDYAKFAAKCKLRHDFDDMIQVRYRHDDGQAYDTWVSGEEVLHRIRSISAEERLRAIRRMDIRRLSELQNELPEEAKARLRDELRDRLSDAVEDAIGGGVIGDSLAEAVRGRTNDEGPVQTAKARWTLLLHDPAFRAIVLELAWIQLEGSIPESNDQADSDDWI